MTMDEAEAQEILRGATQPLTPGPRQLVDPPEVARFAQRGDPDISDWPGRLVTRQDLMMASGDPRDWFRYRHREKAYEEAWHEFVDARTRRKDFMAGFEWNQILVLGDYGSGKTTLATHLARHFFGLGHPVFSNASCLFGWRLEHESMYEPVSEVREVPRCKLLGRRWTGGFPMPLREMSREQIWLLPPTLDELGIL